MTETDRQSATEQKKKISPVQTLLALIVGGAFIWYYFGGGLEQQADKNLQEIKDKVANDAVAQYDIAARNGSAMDRCVQAGLAAASYLQAKNEAGYQQWKAKEKDDCKAAGVPK